LKPGVANVVAGASKMGGDITMLVAGDQCAAAAQAAAKLAGVKKVLHCDAPHYAGFVAENMAALIVPLARSTRTSRRRPPCSARTSCRASRRSSTCSRFPISAASYRPTPSCGPIYAGNALLTVQSSDKIKVVTVRATAFDPVGESASPAPVETLAPGPESPLSKFNGQEVAKSERPELTAARIIVSGGRGMGSAENFQIVEALADKLGAALGPRAPPWTPGSSPTNSRSGRPARSSRPSSTSPSASRARSSTWRA
jgi:electron transfer flavoprotein alpha subunit